MKIFCRNYKCEPNQLLSDPIRFSYRKHRVPLGDDDGYCMAFCKKDFPGFKSISLTTPTVKYRFAECEVGEAGACSMDCVWNTEGNCIREEIFVDKTIVNGETYWVCKCQSDAKISGHIDFSRFGQKKDMY